MNHIYGHGCSVIHDSMPYTDYREAGFHFVVRHVNREARGAAVNRDEIARAHASMVDVCLIWDLDGAPTIGGYTAGHMIGIACRDWLQHLGAPHTVAMYHTINQHIRADTIAEFGLWVGGYERGLAPYRAGIRADTPALTVAKDMFPSVYQWDTLSWGNPGGLKQPELMHMGATVVHTLPCVMNVAYRPVFGQWMANPANQPRSVKEIDVLTALVEPGKEVAIPFEAGSARSLMLFGSMFTDGHPLCDVTVTQYSATGGATEPRTITLTPGAPVTVHFTDSDTHGVLIKNGPQENASMVTAVVI